ISRRRRRVTGGLPSRPRSVPPSPPPPPPLGLPPPPPPLLPVQQLGQDRAVGDIGRRRRHRVDQPGAAIHPEMRLHPEIPLVALFGLVHLRIARLVGILGRRRRIDDGCIDDRAGGYLYSLGHQVPLYLLEQLPAEIVRLEQVAEAAHRGLVGNRLAAEIDPDKAAHRRRIV